MMPHLNLTRPLAWIDCETTGVDTDKDRVVELAVQLWPVGVTEAAPAVKVRRFYPECPIPAEATEVHGITDADVEGEARFEQCAGSLLAILDGADLGGYNLRRFDLPILAAEFERCGQPLDLTGRALIDPLVIFHRMEPRDLEAAVLFYTGAPHRDAHAAAADVVVLPDILLGQLSRYGEEVPRDLAALHEWMDETHRYETPADKWWDRSDPDPRRWVFKRGKWKGHELGEGSLRGYLEWMTGAADMPRQVKDVAHAQLFGRHG